LRDEDVQVRHTAAEALGKIGNPELLPELSNMLLKTQDRYELSILLEAIASIQQRCGYHNYHFAAS
jgi:HEAT repeat protein